MIGGTAPEAALPEAVLPEAVLPEAVLPEAGGGCCGTAGGVTTNWGGFIQARFLR